jgi:hypothetical protein
MRLRIPKVDEDAVAHVLRDEAAEACERCSLGNLIRPLGVRRAMRRVPLTD